MNEISGRPKHVLVIGGGLCGPLVAMALQRVGVAATVFEGHGERDDLAIGAWLTVAVNGLDALRTLGLAEAVCAAGFASREIELMSGSGKRLGAVAIGGQLADGSVTHTVRRADLHRVFLAEARRRGITVLHDKRLVEIHEQAGTIDARFADGSEAHGDVLIGADGVHSRVRRWLDADAPAPRYNRLGNLGGFVPAGKVALPAGTYRMVFGKRAFFGYTVAPGGEVWWFANPCLAEELSREQLRAVDWRARLCELFADDVGPMLELVRATPGELSCFNQYDLADVPVWQRGRVCLVGDAAHAASPSSGQGASMAAEDAIALAAAVAADPGNPEAALAAFVATRRPRTARVVAYGRRYASSKAAGPVGRVLRDLLLPLAFRFQPGPEALAWLYQHHIDLPAREALTPPPVAALQPG